MEERSVGLTLPMSTGALPKVLVSHFLMTPWLWEHEFHIHSP